MRLLVAGVLLASIIGSSAALAGEDPGAAGFNTNCSICHQLTGQGVAGQFPRIAGRVNAIAASAGGRKYLAALVLNGMSGAIKVDGMPIIGVMPGFSGLDDATLAAILNYAQKFDRKTKGASISPADVKAARKDFPLAPAAVHALRDALAPSAGIEH